MRDCHRALTKWLLAQGTDVTLDASVTLRAISARSKLHARRLLLASHLDTVPNAGPYDGVLGVVLAIALLEGLERRRLPFGIEIVGFSEEEGVRFGQPFIGSRALVGRLDEQFLNSRDRDGISIQTAIKDFGLNPAEIPQAIIGEDTFSYLEFHIEQGPVLDSLARPLG